MTQPRSAEESGEGFPHRALTPLEATPRISTDLAGEVLEALRRHDVVFPDHPLAETPPAICIAIWQGPLLKWLVNDAEARQTLDRLRAAEARRPE